MSRRTRASLALIFALVFASAAARRAGAACVPFDQPPAVSSAAFGAVALEAADVDRDGDLDLVTASPEPGVATIWFRNDGDGATWAPLTDPELAGGQDAALAADLDGDGDVDFAGTNLGGVEWFENLANEAIWAAHAVASAGGVGSALAAVDLDGDGDLDLVGARADGSVAWYANDGAPALGPWSAHAIATVAEASALAVADLDGDADVDVAVASRSLDRILAFANDGTGAGWQVRTVTDGGLGAPVALAAGDLDRDGDRDLVAAGESDGRIVWFRNDGAGAGWTAAAIATLASSPAALRLADLDGDGDLDLGSGASDDLARWHENRGAGAAWSMHTLAGAAAGPAALAAGDLDGDGDLDLAVAARDGGQVLWHRNRSVHGSALFLPEQAVSTTADGATSTFAADVDGDGDLDLLSAALYDGRIDWYENDGAGGGWTARQVAMNVDAPYAVSAADVDGDGDTDVLSAATYPNELLWFENDGTPLNGGWKSRSIATEVVYAYSLAPADVDGDGDLDVATASGGDDTIAWFENDGTPASGAWVKHVVTTFATTAYTVFAADLDGDGDLDLLSASGGNDRVAWYQNDGTPADGGWATRIITSAAAYAFAAVAADLDADGDLDVVASAGGDDLLIWFESDGTPASGGWLAHTISTAVAGAYKVAAADLDGDGDLDVAASSYAADAILWFESDGTPDDGGWTAHTTSTAADGAYFVRVADLDGDGDADLLSASLLDDGIAWYPNLGTKVFADGLDSDGDTGCWSATAP